MSDDLNDSGFEAKANSRRRRAARRYVAASAVHPTGRARRGELVVHDRPVAHDWPDDLIAAPDEAADEMRDPRFSMTGSDVG
jgi:hypothetical protein